ncbi:MFS transporter, partial [Streptomyces sp. NRRL F-6602]
MTAAAESPAPAPAPDPTTEAQGHPQRWLILGVICLAELVVLLDNTVLTVAIPSLTRELAASTSDIQWMINAYALVQSGLLLTAGNAADRYGRRKMLLTTTLAVAMQIFAPHEQARAIGIWAAVNALGFAAGPLIGGGAEPLGPAGG